MNYMDACLMEMLPLKTNKKKKSLSASVYTIRCISEMAMNIVIIQKCTLKLFTTKTIIAINLYLSILFLNCSFPDSTACECELMKGFGDKIIIGGAWLMLLP